MSIKARLSITIDEKRQLADILGCDRPALGTAMASLRATECGPRVV